jgi:hypothetical protein
MTALPVVACDHANPRNFMVPLGMDSGRLNCRTPGADEANEATQPIPSMALALLPAELEIKTVELRLPDAPPR